MTDSVLSERTYEADELADLWMRWFEKRAERYLKDAATKGWYEVTLDFPYDLSLGLDKANYSRIMKYVKKRLPGCDISIIEEEYEGDTVYKLEVSWR